MIPGMLLMNSTVNSKIVQGYATINPQSLESTKCGDKIHSFSIFHTVTPSSFGRSDSCKLRKGLRSFEGKRDAMS